MTAPPGGQTVELAGVSKAYGQVAAVDAVDLTLAPGEITALLGPSGCGKTTTLRLVAGFESPDRGEVRIGGVPVAGPGTWVAPERRRVGMVFQQLALFPHLDVAANVAYGLRRHDRARRRARVAELLDLVGLVGYDDRRPDQLSGGQAQRVALARALAPAPDVVLLDEPFSSLDVSLRGDIRAEVRRILRSARTTALLVTHDQDEALAMGDRIAVMLSGRIAQVGSPEALYRRPATRAVAEFLGDTNVFEGPLAGGVLDCPLGPLPLRDDGPADAGHVVAMVRPEDLDLVEDPAGTGRVVDVVYYGHDQVVTVALPSGAQVRARLHARRRFALGIRVRVDARSAYRLP